MSLLDLFTYQLHPIMLKMVMLELSLSKIIFEEKSNYGIGNLLSLESNKPTML